MLVGGKNGYPEYFGKVINAINFIAMDLQIDGQTIDLATTPYEDFSLELDMQNGGPFSAIHHPNTEEQSALLF